MRAPDHRTPGAPTPAAAAAAFDRTVQASLAHIGGGLSPVSLGLAWADWAGHLASAPGTAARLAALGRAAWLDALTQGPEGGRADPRYADAGWSDWPFATLAALHHAAEAWWRDATDLRGVEPHHRDVVQLLAREWLDMLAPSNWPWSNPQVLRVTAQTQGANLARGLDHALDD